MNMLPPECLHVAPVTDGCQQQRKQTRSDHKQTEASRSEKPVALHSLASLYEVLKEFVDRKAESNERRCRPDPGHQRSLVS